MGVFSSKYNLQRERITENVMSGGLVDVVGYLNSEEAERLIAEHILSNWNFRGNMATKENIVILCTAATQGQGKTELCRQLTLHSEKLPKALSDLITFVPIPISFGQFTTFTSDEVEKSVEHALIWRILYAFGNVESCHNYPHSLRHLLKEIRAANIQANNTVKSVGIFLMVDEILKIRDVNQVFFRSVLDTLSNLQQIELREDYPTFLLITSLELVPVSLQIINVSGRKLQLIPIPFLTDMDLDKVSTKLFEEMRTVICAGRSPGDALQLDRFKNLQLLVRVAVSISGRHFRCLEEAFKALYKRLVSAEQHGLALRHTQAHFPKIFLLHMLVRSATEGTETWRRVHDVERKYDWDIFAAKGVAVDLSIKEMFDTTVNQVELSNINKNDYMRAMELFLQLINDSNLSINESDWYDLEASKIVFVKSRNLSRTTYIVPRVNLPFLFLYPRAERLEQCEASDYRDKIERRQRKSVPSPRYLRLRDPGQLKLHVEVLLSNIGTALSLPFRDLPTAFEEIMVFVEMVTVAARFALPSTRMILLQDLIPDVIFKPWENETLTVSSFVSQRPIRVAGHAPQTEAASPSGAVQEAVRYAFDSVCDAVYVTQGRINMERIEHVSRLFSVNNKQVVCLCSMTLREKSDPVALARDLHKFVRESVKNEHCPLEDGSYYAMIYCCSPKASVDIENVPCGTIVVPFESIRQLLYPFGLNNLVLVAEENISGEQSTR